MKKKRKSNVSIKKYLKSIGEYHFKYFFTFPLKNYLNKNLII